MRIFSAKHVISGFEKKNHLCALETKRRGEKRREDIEEKKRMEIFF